MKKLVIFCIVYLIIHLFSVSASFNPAYEYCAQLGYGYSIQETEGGEKGLCIIEGNRYDAWDFLRGKIGKEYSVCARQGYGIVPIVEEKDSYSIIKTYCVNSFEVKDFEDALEDENIDLSPKVQEKGKVSYGETTNYVKNNLPSRLDWRNMDGKAYIGPVRDQGYCGSCYAFGAVAAAEGTYNKAYKINNDERKEFSESFVAFCLGSLKEYYPHFYGCEGADYDYKELEALVKYGVVEASDMKYDPWSNQMCNWKDKRYRFDSWGRIESNNIDAIKSALWKYGVLDVAVDVTYSFSGYNGGVYEDSLTSCPYGDYTATNHAVALVGWGSDKEHGDYWILRNSWGSSWGEKGYMRISVEAARVACAATYLEIDEVDVNEYNKKKRSPNLNLRFDSEVVHAGSSFPLRIALEEGKKILGDVKIKIAIPELGLFRSYKIDNSDSDSIKEVQVDIPQDTMPGEYDVRVSVYGNSLRRIKYRPVTVI